VSGGRGAVRRPGRAIAFYISGHGFGHASRSIEIINELLAADPGLRVVVRTSAARWLFEATVKGPFEYHACQCDTGVVQSDSLHQDEARTIEEAWRFTSRLEELADAEAGVLRALGARMVVADIPPLAFLAARKAGLPAVAIGNFTWDWIYGEYVDSLRSAPLLLPEIRRAYDCATLTLRLPMWGGFEEWASPIVELPFVARHSTRPPEEVRRMLGIPRAHGVVLASFGGLGISGLRLEPLERLAGFTVVTTAHALEAAGPVPPAVRLLQDREVYARGLRYEDLVRAADVVVTKPGYGIIAECIANDTALLYTERGRFAEYDVLVAAMPRYSRSRFIGHNDLYAGRWLEHLEAVLGQPDPPERPRTDGARVAAARLLAVA
jgi:hypothetical protein